MLLLIRDIMRTAHLLAGAVWIGGSVMYLVVINPALRFAKASPEVSREVGRRFRELVNLAIGVLVVTGVFLIFDRHDAFGASSAYLALLGMKIAVVLAMITLAFLLAQEARRPPERRAPLWRYAPGWILGLGCVAFVLGVTLMLVFEMSVGHFQ